MTRTALLCALIAGALLTVATSIADPGPKYALLFSPETRPLWPFWNTPASQTTESMLCNNRMAELAGKISSLANASMGGSAGYQGVTIPHAAAYSNWVPDTPDDTALSLAVLRSEVNGVRDIHFWPCVYINRIMSLSPEFGPP